MASVIGVGPWSPGEGRKDQPEHGPRRHRALHFKTFDRLIESEVIPRLLVAHSYLPASTPVGDSRIGPADVEAFAPLAVTLEAHELLGEVEAFVRQGLSVEQVFVELLAPAARYLGEQWKEDRLDFLDVTMGLWRLQEVLREIAARTPPTVNTMDNPRTALFSPFPGDQHSFGTAIIDECFSRAGWDTELLLEPTRAELVQKVAAKRFDLVGLTVSCDCHIAQLPSLLTAVRNVSKNPKICLMLGGRILVEDPGLADVVGADGTALTALGALEVADRLMIPPPNAALA